MSKAIGLTLALLLLLLTPTTDAATVRWNAVGDDSLTGQASYYQLFYDNEPVWPDTAAWSAQASLHAFDCSTPSGERDSVAVQVAGGQTWHFLLRVGDEVWNWSGWSNVASVYVPELEDVTPPARVQDLEVVVYPNPTPSGGFFREDELEVRE